MKKVWNGITTALTALVVLLALAAVGARLAGLTPYCVRSGSMAPAYPVGALIFVQRCGAQEVQPGDAITFVANEALDVVTHRVVSVDAAAGSFVTRGDANDTADACPVLFENLIGKPVCTIPYLGYLVDWAAHPPGVYLALAIAAALAVLLLLPELARRADSERSAT